jgi:hypothetical protein
MNKLKLKEFSENRVIYFYIPEGRGEAGEIEYNLKKHTAEILKRAEENSGLYAHKALIKIEKCVEENNLPIEFIQAWY